MKLRAIKPETLTVEIVEKAIKVKANRWPGNCYGIACMIVERGLVKGRAVYGHWLGRVAKTGYWANRRDQAFQRHGWVELQDGRILDPTRWSFEDKKPYLYIAEPPSEFLCLCGHVVEEHENGFFRKCEGCGCLDFEVEKSEYDEGANRLRAAMLRPPPAFVKTDKELNLVLKSSAKVFVMDLLKHPKAITTPMIFWLGNLPLDHLGPFAKEVYGAIVKAGWPEVIPIDNRRKILGDG